MSPVFNFDGAWASLIRILEEILIYIYIYFFHISIVIRGGGFDNEVFRRHYNEIEGCIIIIKEESVSIIYIINL